MPNYIPAHGQSLEESAGARLECKAISEGMLPQGGGGFIAASGKPAFVGAAMGGYALGLAIGAAIRQQHKIELYDDCMVAHGFRKASDVVAQAPIPASTTTVGYTVAEPVRFPAPGTSGGYNDGNDLLNPHTGQVTVPPIPPEALR